MISTTQTIELRQVPLSAVRGDFSRYLREAERQEIVITRRGKPAGVLIGFESEHQWLDYRLVNERGFLERVAAHADEPGAGVTSEDIQGVALS